jgi:hypothetical protein
MLQMEMGIFPVFRLLPSPFFCVFLSATSHQLNDFHEIWYESSVKRGHGYTNLTILLVR